MGNKYYTPSIEDIRVGYECEILPINESKGWKKAKLKFNPGYEDKENPNSLYNLSPFWYSYVKIDNLPIMAQVKTLNNIRTPYLTKEQIEGEGWEFSHRFEGGSPERYEEVYQKDFSGGFYRLSINQDRFVSISLWLPVKNEDKACNQTHWRGILPSVNELRLIEKLLGIK